MKIFKYIIAAAASIALLSSCSVLKSVATNAMKAAPTPVPPSALSLTN